MGAFRSTKICGLKFRKFHVPNGTVLSGYADPTQATILSNGKGNFGPTDRNDQTSQRGPPSKLVPNIPVGPNRNRPFHLMYQPKFPEFWVDWKAPYTSGLDDVWAGCNSGFLLHGDTNFRFICNCFFSVALRYLLFRLECFRWYCVYLFLNVRSI